MNIKCLLQGFHILEFFSMFGCRMRCEQEVSTMDYWNCLYCAVDVISELWESCGFVFWIAFSKMWVFKHNGSKYTIAEFVSHFLVAAFQQLAPERMNQPRWNTTSGVLLPDMVDRMVSWLLLVPRVSLWLGDQLWWSLLKNYSLFIILMVNYIW